MNARVAGLVVVLCLVAPVAAGLAAPAAAQANETATATPTQTPTSTPTQAPSPTPTPTSTPTPDGSTGGNVDSGEYSITELRTGGTQPEDAPTSVRYLVQNNQPVGAVAIRYTPAEPTNDEQQFLKAGTTLHTDDIQVFSTRFGSVGTKDYTLHAVFWQPDTRTVETGNGTRTEEYAANQTTKTYRISLRTGYDTSNLTFPSHFNERWEATMWLTKGGERVDGARWRLKHRSDPGGKSINIDTETDAWTFTAKNAVFPGGIGLVAGLLFSRGTLRRTGRGPDMGAFLWVFIGLVIIGGTASVGYFQAAVILDHAPWVMGALFTIVGYGGGFLFSNPVRRIGFERQEILDAKTLPGFEQIDNADAEVDEILTDGGTTGSADTDFIANDEYKEELWRELPEKRAVRGENGFLVPVKGIRPFLARLFANAARLDLSRFRTRIIVTRGRLDEIIHVDPESEVPVRHTPAHLRRALPWDVLPRDEETGDIVVDWQEQAIAAAMTLGILAGPAALGFWILDAGLGIPTIGVLLGLIVTATLAYTAEDGEIDFDEAPIHDNPARTTITHMQVEHKDAKDIKDSREREYTERAKNAREAREEREHEKRTVTDEALETLVGETPTDHSPDHRENGHEPPEADAGDDKGEDDDDDE